MKEVYLFEISDITANQVRLPYSTGLIWGYCALYDDIKLNYNLSGWFYYREKIDKILNEINSPSVIGFSNFVWNGQFNYNLAKKIKEKYPNCVVIFGGQGTPKSDRVSNFFIEHPYIDIAVHGEGEVTFKEILLENLKENPNYKNILGCSVKQTDLSSFITLPRPRIKDIDSMPSPMLDGLFNKLIKTKNHSYKFEGTIESVRGCPYQCTFCEIGDLYFQKIARQSNKKIFKELDWLSKNKIEFFYNADSNFGLLPEHKDIVRYVTELKKKTGYPDNIRIDWAKSSADKVIELAEMLTDAQMMKGITIALQSMNPEVLMAIKRKNVDGGKLKEFFDLYKDKELVSYVELILGLPMETIESFKNGIFQILDLEYHDYIGVYPMTALPNTPFFDPEYIKKYDIDIIETTPAFFHHDYPDKLKSETEHMVVGSKTMSRDEYIEASLWRWLFMVGHNLGHVQYIARFLKYVDDISYREFYKKLYSYIVSHPTSLLGSEYLEIKNLFKKIFKKEALWGKTVEITGNYHWDFEEATSITIALNRDKFFNDIRDFLSQFNLNKSVESDIIEFQSTIIKNPLENYPIKKKFNHNIKEVLFNNKSLKNTGYIYQFDSENYKSDIKKWCTINMWWGRRNREYEVEVI
jgi:putative methyltransferase